MKSRNLYTGEIEEIEELPDGEILRRVDNDSALESLQFHFPNGQILDHEKVREYSFEYLDDLLKRMEKSDGNFCETLSAWLKLVLESKVSDENL